MALKLLDPAMRLIETFGKDWKFVQFKKQIVDMNVYVNSEGKFGARPEEILALEEA